MAERKNSEARIKANNKYNGKAYDRINIAVPKGRKAEIQTAADKQRQSVNGYVVQAVEERMARDMDGIKEAQGE